jgi:hypothetical protein
MSGLRQAYTIFAKICPDCKSGSENCLNCPDGCIRLQKTTQDRWKWSIERWGAVRALAWRITVFILYQPSASFANIFRTPFLLAAFRTWTAHSNFCFSPENIPKCFSSSRSTRTSPLRAGVPGRRRRKQSEGTWDILYHFDQVFTVCDAWCPWTLEDSVRKQNLPVTGTETVHFCFCPIWTLKHFGG